MNRKLLSALILAGTAMAAPAAFAEDGVISFGGTVTGQTCTINGNRTGASSFLVPLPTVSVSALKKAGQRAGSTPFSIFLTDCTPGANSVRALFEAHREIDMETGNLILDAGGAPNVQIGLVTPGDLGYYTVIQLNRRWDLQGSTPVAIEGGSAELKYVAEYVATGPAGPGPAKSRVLYSLVYE
ncbi:fimbrial protein [Variovorax sp. Sphag1AA]|uniref:fimbrial protein n=1 Tax=Variovorax sp. Sphag1AA TaxID=2587027 RepID=UPI00161A0E71|nr:fimbrial protein [Variovorax sp. Sphag1AA]MBB3179087.1 major type 1 subunit fimbrin (pilin) [Variovorax sp. Sphag1AA]